jgi:polysaccharide export outer membrane protein
MKFIAAVVTVVLSLAAGTAFAQQGVTKPVLSATPPPAAAPQQPAAGAQPGLPAAGPGAAAAPAVPAPVTDAAAQAPANVSASYIISRGDTIQVSVWREPGISGTLPVRPDGMISLSLLGDTPAAGFTPMKLGDDIAQRLKKFMNDPNVTVTVVSVRPKEIYLMGEVNHVGPVPISEDMTVLQAIAAGGGITPFANGKKMYILRADEGKQKKIPFDYKKAIKGDTSQAVTLLPGDTIVVP